MHKYFFILIAFSAVLFSCNPKKSKLPEDILNDTTLNIEQLNKLIRENPKNADLFIKRSELFLTKEKNIKEAINDLEIALKVDTTRQEIYIKLADLLIIDANSEKAKKVLELCLKRYPFFAKARVDLAKIYFYVQMYQEAMVEILNLENNNLQNTDSYFIKALILNETLAYKDAIIALKKSIEYDNNNWEAYNLIGMIYAQLDDTLALEYFKTASNLFPLNAEIQYHNGWVLQQFDKTKNAIEQYEKVVKIDNQYYEAYYNLGYLYSDIYKDYFKAIDFFTEAIRCDSLAYKAWYNRGFSYEQTNQLSLAEADYRKVLKIFPNFDPAVNGLNAVIDKKRK